MLLNERSSKSSSSPSLLKTSAENPGQTLQTLQDWETFCFVLRILTYAVLSLLDCILIKHVKRCLAVFKALYWVTMRI